ncbi:hypothetical protein JW613_30990 [Streptomyces smyrnaeus]|uniref:AAA+ ATPase domain-containing protein n=1 Tax=Streptomyces smyrnaeus TaxID=1387713 RepID=A0ABS3Y512_9ACTN|nr:hypothetical protein [Streptomyces smyrnaeus]MBO8202674.1 hypothetical protein [Streptomyces smyrnaeus]
MPGRTVRAGDVREALQRCAIAACLALSERYFAFGTVEGRRGVPLDFAQMFAARRTDVWGKWRSLPRPEYELVGRLWQALKQEGDLAQPETFREAALEYAVAPAALFKIPETSNADEAHWLVACHAQEPLTLAEHLVQEAEGYRASLEAPLPTAGEGLWSFGRDRLYTVEIPASEKNAFVSPVRLHTEPFLKEAHLPRRAVMERVVGQAAAWPETFGWKPGLLQGFFDRLTDAYGRTAAELRLPAGAMTLLNAPTGVGKSVLMRDAAHLLAASGQGPVLIVVGRIREGLNTAEQLAADNGMVEETVCAVQDAAERAGKPLRVVPWVASSSIDDQATLAFAQGREGRFERFASGCEMTGWQVDGPRLDRTTLPCTRLEWVDGPVEPEGGGKHLCPRMGICQRFEHIRQAAEADIIVTNHLNLIRGRCKVPVEVDGERVVSNMSVLEFVLRRCRVVIIDEVDAFQSTWCTYGAQEFTLISRGRGHAGRLEEVDRHRGGLSALENLLVTGPLMEARRLSETFLDNILTGHLYLESEQERQNRPGSGWYMVGKKDAELCRTLTGASADAEVTEDVHQAYLALFPGERTSAELPEGWQPLADQIGQALAGKIPGTHRSRKLAVFKDSIARILAEAPFNLPASQRAALVNDLLVRAWLGALHNELHTLKWSVLPLLGQLNAATDLVSTMGLITRDEPIPYGPLGQNLYGFKLDKNASGTGRLSLQSLSGDPHTSTVRLGDTVALATAGVRRSVLGLSATAFFPRAALQHVHTLPAYVMTDATDGAVTAHAGSVSATDAGWQPIAIGGVEERRKPSELRTLAERLWHTRMSSHLEKVARHDPRRELALLAGNSYFHAEVMAAGIAAACGRPEWVAVLVSNNQGSSTRAVTLPEGVVRVTIDQLEDLPATHPRVKVICAPISVVSRGLNILIPHTDRSALASVWVGVRPITHLHEPAVMYASINACGIAAGTLSPDPAAMLASQRIAAIRHRELLLRTDPRFSLMPKFLKTEILAGILVELIQLAGRARRGGTPVELYLVDHAFFNQQLGCDFPRLLRAYYGQLDTGEQDLLRRVYGSTLTAWLDLAHSEDLPPNPVTLIPAPNGDDQGPE